MRDILELFTQPAFLVSEGIVTWRNHASYAFIREGMPLACLLENHGALYTQWDGKGTIHIPLLLAGMPYDATVCKTEMGELFVAAEEKNTGATGTAMINASNSMRKPLQNLVTASDTLFHRMEDSTQLGDAIAMLNRSVYQMLRMCGQMSDGGRLLLQRYDCRKEGTDLGEFFTTFTHRVTPLLERGGWVFRYVGPRQRILADVDCDLLERAVYNLLSNALRFTPKGGTIELILKRSEQHAFISVSDSGEGIAPDCVSTVLEGIPENLQGDPRRGLGMGLQMVREIARLHGGAMMLSASNENAGTNVTFSLSLARAPLSLKSHLLRYDYCGGFNHALVELSDVLGVEYFDPKEV